MTTEEMSLHNNARASVWTERLPYLASGLLWIGNLQQVIQMLISGSAEGQSLSGWATVFVALIVWQVYYWSRKHDGKSAVRSTWVSLSVTGMAILTIVLLQT